MPMGSAAFADEPEVVTAEAVHVRVNDGNRRGSCDHGLDSVTAISKNREAGLGCKVVGRDDHAASAEAFRSSSFTPVMPLHFLRGEMMAWGQCRRQRWKQLT